jgi:hypothetical protein
MALGGVLVFAKGMMADFALVLTLSLVSLFFVRRARATGKVPTLRRIQGLDAIQEAVGRATEMGRPVMYLPGAGDFSAPELLASMTILEDVSRVAARYESRLLVVVDLARVQPVIHDIVRQGYTAEGRVEQFRSDDVMWFSDFWSGHCMGVIGTMWREKVAANIMLGGFYANSLMFAETGNHVGAIQIGGTASVIQIPFFVAACDYALIGEELYAAAAYISREPVRVSSIVAQDLGKLVTAVLILAGALSRTLATDTWLRDLLAK